MFQWSEDVIIIITMIVFIYFIYRTGGKTPNNLQADKQVALDVAGCLKENSSKFFLDAGLNFN